MDYYLKCPNENNSIIQSVTPGKLWALGRQLEELCPGLKSTLKNNNNKYCNVMFT